MAQHRHVCGVSGRIAAGVHAPSRHGVTLDRRERAASGGAGRDLLIPYCADPRFGVSPSGEYVAQAFVESGKSGFTLAMWTVRGAVRWRTHLAFPRVPVPDQVQAMIRALFDTALTPEVRKAAVVPTLRRNFSTVFADDEGSVWISLDSPAGIPHRWVEVDHRGRLLGLLVVPRDIAVTAVARDTLWAHHLSDPGMAVMVFRIVRR